MDSCWCGAYYAAVCYMCSPQEDPVTGETFVFVDDDICGDLGEVCKTVSCCENTGDAETCLDNHNEDGYTVDPTSEPTLEPTYPPSMQGNGTEAKSLASTCDPAVEMVLPQCSVTDAYACTANPECRWRPAKGMCVGICQDRPEDSCRGRNECAWDMERECCAKA